MYFSLFTKIKTSFKLHFSLNLLYTFHFKNMKIFMYFSLNKMVNETFI